MDAERLFIAKVAQSGGLDRAVAEGIGPEHFSDPTASEAWRYMADHWRRYGQQPSFALVREKFPSYDFPLAVDAFEYLQEQFIWNVDRREASMILEELAKQVNSERKFTMAQLFSEQTRRLQQKVPKPAAYAKFSDMEFRIAEYEAMLKDGKTPWGIKMGIPLFDDYTMGIQPHEYVSIQGFLGMGKSTLCQWIMLNAYMQEKKLLYISLEMESRALMKKWDVMATNVLSYSMKSGTLTKEELKAWKDMAKKVKGSKGDIIVVDDVQNYTVDKVYAEIDRHSPDMVAIDYLTLMSAGRSVDAKDWEKVKHISNNLKQVSRNTMTPIIAVAQTNRDSEKVAPSLGSVGYSLSINQDSDIAITVFRNEELIANRRMQVTLLKNRDGRIGQAELHWDLDRMYFYEAQHPPAGVFGVPRS